ncbi:MAG: HEAT repeat domain-containing protein [bacterium]
MKRTIYFCLILAIFLINNFAGAEEKPVLNFKYQNGLLSADLKSATIKEIFNELGKQGGFTYEIEKEIQEQKVTISFKDKKIEEAIKDILNTIGNPSYMITYKTLNSKSETLNKPETQNSKFETTHDTSRMTQYEISSISIRRRGKSDTSAVNFSKLDLKKLISGISGKDYTKRLKVLEEIKKRRKEAVPILIEIVKDKSGSEDEKIMAMMFLGELKAKEAKKDIEDILKEDKNQYCREASVLALAGIGETTSIQLIKEGLNDESGNVRQRAVLALAKLGDKSHSDIALKGIKEGNPTEKLLATMALEEIGDTSVIKELKAEELKAKDVWTKINAKLAIKKIEYRNTKEGNKLVYLQEALKDEQFEVNSWVVEELAKINSSDAIKILEDSAKDKEIAGSYAAGKYLRIRKGK